MFHALKDEAVYMLESQEPESPWSNFSFIGINPMMDVVETTGEFVISDLQYGSKTRASSFKEAFEYVLLELDVKIPETDIPFKGGGVGYISYDAISDYEPVPARTGSEKKLPNYHLLFCQTLLAYNHRTRKITILTFARIDDETDRRAVFDRSLQHIRHIRERLVKKSELTDIMMPVDLYDSPVQKMDSNYTKNKFKEDVSRVKKYIKEGDILQAVLS